MIIEIAFDLTNREQALEDLESLLARHSYNFYTEPANNFASLEDVECQCEGK
jgi:hypothetical protein